MSNTIYTRPEIVRALACANAVGFFFSSFPGSDSNSDDVIYVEPLPQNAFYAAYVFLSEYYDEQSEKYPVIAEMIPDGYCAWEPFEQYDLGMILEEIEKYADNFEHWLNHTIDIGTPFTASALSKFTANGIKLALNESPYEGYSLQVASGDNSRESVRALFNDAIKKAMAGDADYQLLLQFLSEKGKAQHSEFVDDVVVTDVEVAIINGCEVTLYFVIFSDGTQAMFVSEEQACNYQLLYRKTVGIKDFGLVFEDVPFSDGDSLIEGRDN